MFKVNAKNTIFTQTSRRISQLFDDSEQQALSKSNSYNYALLILGVVSSTAWVLGDRAAIAANSNTDSHQSQLASVSVPGVANTRSPIHFQIAQSNPNVLQETQSQDLPLPESQPASSGDAELGTLRLQRQQLQLPRLDPVGYVLGQVGYFQTNNVFSGVDPIEDGLFSGGLTLWLTPKLGDKTYLVAAVDGKLVRYLEQSEVNYNQLKFRAGIRQQLTDQMYGEIGWNNQQLFSAKKGDRFLNENSLRFALQRYDKLSNKLWLNSFYELRLSSADPESRSRIINSLTTSLNYYIQPRLQVGLEYQFALSDFTQREREDTYHLIAGGLTYTPSRNSQISVQGGVSLGNSSDPTIDFNNLFFSVNYTVEIGEF